VRKANLVSRKKGARHWRPTLAHPEKGAEPEIPKKKKVESEQNKHNRGEGGNNKSKARNGGRLSPRRPGSQVGQRRAKRGQGSSMGAGVGGGGGPSRTKAKSSGNFSGLLGTPGAETQKRRTERPKVKKRGTRNRAVGNGAGAKRRKGVCRRKAPEGWDGTKKPHTKGKRVGTCGLGGANAGGWVGGGGVVGRGRGCGRGYDTSRRHRENGPGPCGPQRRGGPRRPPRVRPFLIEEPPEPRRKLRAKIEKGAIKRVGQGREAHWT